MLVMHFGGDALLTPSALDQIATLAGGSNEEALIFVISGLSGEDLALENLGKSALAGAEELDRLRQDLWARREALAGKHFEKASLRREFSSFLAEQFREIKEVCHGIRLLREFSPRTAALLASYGPRLSARFLACVLRSKGLAALDLDTQKAFVTTGVPKKAEILLETSREALRKLVEPVARQGRTAILAGGIGHNFSGEASFLGPEGSESSATAAAAILGAREVWFWKTGSGVMTAHPQVVKEARPLEAITYREAAEMSYFGAHVLHPRALTAAVAGHIPLRIKSFQDPTSVGCLIHDEIPIREGRVAAVTSIPGLCLITLEGTGMVGDPSAVKRLFSVTAACGAELMMISQASSEHSISLALPEAQASLVKEALESEFEQEMSAGALEPLAMEHKVGIIAIVGEGMRGIPGIASSFFGALGSVGINILAISQGSSEVNISALLHESSLDRAVRAAHTAFGLTKVLNAFIFGYGNVGRTLVRQILENRETIAQRSGLRIRLLGAANSKSMILVEDGLPDSALPGFLSGKALSEQPGAEAAPSQVAILDRVARGRDSEVVIVDVTADDSSDLHLEAVKHGFHVVSANKKPLASSLARYREIRQVAAKTGSRYLYETTFGAGLPLLFTLQDLLSTGDRINRLIGALSGTLGFICAGLEGGKRLSEVTREAFERGYTEPDPREDLSGMDVARKALIIAREIGLEVELSDFAVEGLVPKELLQTSSIEAFWAKLPEYDEAFQKLSQDAASKGMVRRYVAEIRRPEGSETGTMGVLEVGMKEFSMDSAFGRLKGPDNLLLYHTSRYSSHPLVIQGPGAGAEVTAAGVLGDMLKVGKIIK